MDMVSLQKLRQIARQTGNRVSKKALKKLDAILEKRAEEILRKAKRNADFAGRSTIREEDIQDR